MAGALPKIIVQQGRRIAGAPEERALTEDSWFDATIGSEEVGGVTVAHGSSMPMQVAQSINGRQHTPDILLKAYQLPI